MRRAKERKKRTIQKNLKNQNEKLKLLSMQDDEPTNFRVNKSVIIKAWRKYDPYIEHESSDEDEPLKDKILRKGPKRSTIHSKFRKMVGNKMLKFLSKTVNKTKGEQNYAKLETTTEGPNNNKRILETDSQEVDEDEANELVEDFLYRFVISSYTEEEDEINLYHALRALPTRINEHNVDRIELLNLSKVQMSVISFQNDDKDELFNFYDKRMRNRLYLLRENSEVNVNEVGVIQYRMLELAKKAADMFGLKNKLDLNRDDSDSSNIGGGTKSDSASDF